ncbi:hypothetical protein G6F24_016556 [Rhizopus arrhizus]|nr:hypothetical protein G6F24_016556 [Rhizopus arrhizus]
MGVGGVPNEISLQPACALRARRRRASPLHGPAAPACPPATASGVRRSASVRGTGAAGVRSHTPPGDPGAAPAPAQGYGRTPPGSAREGHRSGRR